MGLVGDSKKVDGKEHLAKAQSLSSPFYLSGENSSRIHIIIITKPSQAIITQPLPKYDF